MATIKINGTAITPTPLITTFKRAYTKSAAGEVLSCGYEVTLEGSLCTTSGFEDLITQQKALLDMFGCDCFTFVLECNSTTLISSNAALVGDIDFKESPNQWTQNIPYTIQLSLLDTNEVTCCKTGTIKNVSETWSIKEDPECFQFTLGSEVNNLRAFLITHDISATAVNYCSSGGHEVAKEWVKQRLGFDTGIFFLSELGVQCISGWELFNHVIVNDIDEAGGSFKATENWVMLETTGVSMDLLAAKENYTVNISRSSNSRLTTVSLQGTINGYEQSTGTTCKTVTRTKYYSAKQYFGSVTGLFLDRAQNASGLTLSPLPVSSSRSEIPKLGTINYAYTYDNCTPCITGMPTGYTIMRERVKFSDSSPKDIYSTIQILGRPCPLLGNLGMKTKGTKTLSINLVVDGPQICYTDTSFFAVPFQDVIDGVKSACYSMLTGTYDTIFEDGDSTNWDPCEGVYSRTVTWSYSDCCTGTYP